MKKYIIFFTILIFGSLYNILNAQQVLGRWVIPTMSINPNYQYASYQLTFTDDGLIDEVSLDHVVPLNGNDYHDLSGGCYDENYNRQCYVVDERLCASSTNIWNTRSLLPEYQIINRYGMENEYFSFFTDIEPHDKALSYNEISFNTITGQANSNNRTELFGGIDLGYVGFAIDNEESEQRELYTVATSSEQPNTTFLTPGLRKWIITQNSVSLIDPPIVDHTNQYLSENHFDAYNVEHTILNDGGQDIDVIAWIHDGDGITNDVGEIVVVLDDNPVIVKIIDLELGRIGGIEFSAYENNMLYASTTNGGIIKIDYMNYTSTNNIIAVTGAPVNDFGRTFLQTAPDGHIYAVSNDGTKLGRIYQYDWEDEQTLWNAGEFNENAHTFTNSSVSTFRVFNSENYYILPENQRVHNIMTNTVESTPTCPGQTNGTATITVEGGFPTYTLELVKDNEVIAGPYTNNGEPHTFTNLGVGDYRCVVTDSYGNVMNVDFTIEEIDYDENFFVTYSSSNDPIIIDNIDVKTYKLGFELINNTKMTISNSTFMFGPDAKIIIEPGSELIVNGSTLTNYEDCYDPWQGVQVVGNSNMSQYQYPDGTIRQGMLVVKNNSHIKNAWIGITNYKKNVVGSNGGIVLLSNSTFQNNMRTVDFREYTNFNPSGAEIRLPYRCEFINCDFEVNNSYLFTEDVTEFIKFDNVDGINIRGCRFHNNHTAGQNRGIGINSMDAGYHIVDYVNFGNTYISEFYNLYKGLNVLNDGSGTNTIVVDSVDFINNSIGIYISGVNYPTIIDSKFEIGYNDVDWNTCGGYSMGYGIDIHNSIGFAIEENSFTKMTGTPTGYYTGIRNYECPCDVDWIYLNTFTNLSYGNYAYGMNRETIDDKQGLKYECNLNSNNNVDFIVTSEDADDAMIHTHQGEDGVEANGNTFSDVNFPEIDWSFRQEGKQTIIWYYCNESCTNQYPEHVYTTHSDYFKIEPEPKKDCLSHYNDISSIKLSSYERQIEETEYALNKADYDNVKVLYDNLKDGGNTTSELLDIETATPNDMWTLRTQLLGDSPHLSEEVLKAVADRTDVFPESVIFDIMAANPDEMQEEELLDYLENKEDPLPDYMISILRDLADGGTYKSILLRDMANYHAASIRPAQNIIRSILSDSVADQTDLRNWLDNFGSMGSDKQIIESFLYERDTTNAVALLNMLPAMYELSSEDLDDYNNYSYLINLQVDQIKENRSKYQLDSTEIIELSWLADSANGSTQAYAKNILEFTQGASYCDCLYVNDTSLMKSTDSFNDFSVSYQSGKLSARPNPAKEWTEFEYELPLNAMNGKLILSTIRGEIIEILDITTNKGLIFYDTRKIPNGIYLYTLKSYGTSITEKLIVNH